MKCERCNGSTIFLAHDPRAEAHSWSDEAEAACSCGVELVCATCESARIGRDGFLLLPRAFPLARGVASVSRLRH